MNKNLINFISNELRELKKQITLDETYRKTKYKFLRPENVQDGSFEKQIRLKETASRELKGAFDNWAANLWIVKEWGRIKSFKIDDERGKGRILQFERELKEGMLTYQSYSVISSLSKIASFVNPKEYFVYDSRVAYALNVLIMEYNYQKDMGTADERYYQVPSSLGSRTEEIKSAIEQKNGEYRDNQANYFDYLELIKKIYPLVFKGEDNCPYKIEMLLFALGATGGMMADRLKMLFPEGFRSSLSTKSTNIKSKGKVVKDENIQWIQRQKGGRIIKYVKSSSHPELFLYVGAKGKHAHGVILPFYCELILKENKGVLSEILGNELMNSLSIVLNYTPRNTKRYIYSTNETTLEEAEAVYNKALDILKRNGISM